MKKIKIAFIGTRGIPNHYGGFEQFADILSRELVDKGHEITVYCSANHPYQQSIYKGVNLIHKYDPENRIGTGGQFIYDLVCMLDARKRDFDIIYMLGYTSSSVWQWLIYNAGALVITNMDGLEWKRAKYSKMVQYFLKYAEKLAIKYSDHLVADSIGIQTYLNNKYGVRSTYLPYGSFLFDKPDEKILENYELKPYNYDLLIARFEPENNIEIVLSAFSKSDTNRHFLLIGNHNHTEFGRRLVNLYSSDKRIKFAGSIYDQDALNNIRYFSNLYFHGHSVGGTNPSLLEAMGSSALICYHSNEFNKSILENEGFPFTNVEDLTLIINSIQKSSFPDYIMNNLHKISTIYNWKTITGNYEKLFQEMTNIKLSGC